MIVLIAGSPSSGKTTISRNLCEIAKQKYSTVYHLEIDDIRSICITDDNYLEYGSDWLKIVECILNLLTQKYDYFIIVEGLFFEIQTIEFLNSITTFNHYFVIKSDLEICLSRNRHRLQNEEILPDSEIISLHNLIRPDYLVVIENNLDLNQPIDKIWKIIDTL